MELFNSTPLQNLPGTPLSEILRPQNFSSFVGQSKVTQKILAFEKAKYLPSLIFWGPPGTGKTTLALLISKHFDYKFIQILATETGAKEMRQIGEAARDDRRLYQKKTLLFIDEIHRLNKSQQDVLLPFLEKGDVTLIGATTENPSYEINRALLSRCQLMVFERLSNAELEKILSLAVKKRSQNLEAYFSNEARDLFLDWCDGDSRRLLLILEEIFSLAAIEDQVTESARESGIDFPLNSEQLISFLGRSPLGYDKKSDEHFDVISAFIKSLRGSDPDAGLYYLSRMLKAGEDIRFIARRMMIFASEDVGNADPRGLQVAVNCSQAVEVIGMPEAAIVLAQAVTYLACAPKSNRSYMALKKAQTLVEETGTQSIPLHLRSAKTAVMKNLGYGVDYQYPHDFSKSFIPQRYLPEGITLKDPLYIPSGRGFEKTIEEYLKWVKEKKDV